MSSARTTGVLLALTGDDSGHVRAIDAAGTGLVVVRRCGDVAELLSAALAGLGRLAVVSAELDDVDLTVLDRLSRAGARGILLIETQEAEGWSVPGWQVLGADAAPSQVRAMLQALNRQDPGTAAAEDGARRAGVPGRTASDGTGDGPREQRLRPGAAGTSAPGGAGYPPAGPSAAAPVPPTATEERSGERRERGRIVVVWGPHGAPGRSTVAASLATGLTGAGPTILVDADTEAPCLAQALSLPDGSAALATAARLASRSHLDRESFAGLLVPLGPTVSVLPGLGRSGRWRELPPAAMARVWERCREHAAWTVVDICGGVPEDEVDAYTLEPGPGALRVALLREADVIVVVGGADPVGIRRLLQLLADVAEDLSVTGRLEVVVNRVRASAAGPAPERAVREALARFGGLEEAVLLPEDEAADACLLEGRSVLDGAPATPLGQALAVLIDRVDPSSGARSRAASARRARTRSRLASLRRAGWWPRSRSRSAPPPPPGPASIPPVSVASASEPPTLPSAPVSIRPVPAASAPSTPTPPPAPVPFRPVSVASASEPPTLPSGRMSIRPVPAAPSSGTPSSPPARPSIRPVSAASAPSTPTPPPSRASFRPVSVASAPSTPTPPPSRASIRPVSVASASEPPTLPSGRMSIRPVSAAPSSGTPSSPPAPASIRPSSGTTPPGAGSVPSDPGTVALSRAGSASREGETRMGARRRRRGGRHRL